MSSTSKPTLGARDGLDDARRQQAQEFAGNGVELAMDSVDHLQVDMTHPYRRPALVKDYDYGQFFFDLRSRIDKVRQDLIDHLRQTPGMQHNAARTSRRQRHLPTCVFCRKNNEVTMLVYNHEVKDGADTATCPMLRQFVCAICGASGDTAHTLKYCPLAHTVPFRVMVMLRHLTDNVNERHKQQRYQAQQQQRQHSQQQQRQHSISLTILSNKTSSFSTPSSAVTTLTRTHAVRVPLTPFTTDPRNSRPQY